MRPTALSSTEAGFTLVEMLAALTLVALALALLAGSLRWGQERFQAAATETRRNRDQIAVAERLATDLRQSMGPLHGTAQELTLTLFEPPRPGRRGGWFLARYRLEGSRLLYRRQPLPATEPLANDAMAAVERSSHAVGDSMVLPLPGAVSAATFAYAAAGGHDPSHGWQWQESWEQFREQPRLIRLSGRSHGWIFALTMP